MLRSDNEFRKVNCSIKYFLILPHTYYLEWRSVICIVYCCTDPTEPNKIGVEGCIRFLEDLKLDPSSRTVLLIAWKCKAATQCEFTKEEFAQGLVAMG